MPRIVRGQSASEDAAVTRVRVLICDTDPLTTLDLERGLFGTADPHVVEAADQRRYDLYLLLDVDVPWVGDVVRDLPQKREQFFEHCRRQLTERGRPFVYVRGTWEECF